jgi:hypothetical protein
MLSINIDAGNARLVSSASSNAACLSTYCKTKTAARFQAVAAVVRYMSSIISLD